MQTNPFVLNSYAFVFNMLCGASLQSSPVSRVCNSHYTGPASSLSCLCSSGVPAHSNSLHVQNRPAVSNRYVQEQIVK